MTATGSPDAVQPQVADAEPDETGRAPDRPARTVQVEAFAWLFVLVAAALFRLGDLAATPLSAGEGGRALQSWLVANGRVPGSWPGGIVDALTALLFRVFGGGDGAARLVPALAGIGLVASLWLLRPHVGRGAALIAALLAAISPLFVLDGRSAGGESLGALFAVVLLTLIMSFIERPTRRHVTGIIVVLSLGLATDAVFVGSTLLIGVWLSLRAARGDSAVAGAWKALRAGRPDWQRSAVPLALAGLLLTTSRFGMGFARLRPAALASWATAFTPSHLGPPWHYLLDVLAGYELPVLLLAAGGVAYVVRRGSRSWAQLEGLLVLWLGGGCLLNVFMAGRQPSTLLLTLLPMYLLAGIGAARLLRGCARLGFEALDGVLAIGLAIALIYFWVSAASWVGGTDPTGNQDALQTVAGLAIAIVCTFGALLRWRQDGVSAATPSFGVGAIASIIFLLHGASSLAFGTGDEYAIGPRTTPEAVAVARVLVNNGGGVSNVTDDALGPLAWYLRGTVASGGHGGAQIIARGQPAPSGFSVTGDPVVLGRAWSPDSFSREGMVRWWLSRQAWGTASGSSDVIGQLVVAK